MSAQPVDEKEGNRELALLQQQALTVREDTTQALAVINTDVTTFSAYRDALLSDAERAAADDLANRFVAKSVLIVSSWGAEQEMKVAEQTEPILRRARARDTGLAKEPLEQFVAAVEKIDFGAADRDPNALEYMLMKISDVFDPFLAWLKKLESLESLLDRHEAKLRQSSNLMIDRVTWFEQRQDILWKLIPMLYRYTAAAEKVLDREDAKLQQMKAEAPNIKDPRYPIQLQQKSTLVTALRARVLDLHEASQKALLLIPVMEQSKRAAELVNQGALKAANSTIGSIRSTLAVLIGQHDIQEVAQQVAAVEDLDAKLLGKLGESLGKTNDAVQMTLEQRRAKAAAVEGLVKDLTAQIRRAIEIDTQFAQTYEEVLAKYGEITESARAATAALATA